MGPEVTPLARRRLIHLVDEGSRRVDHEVGHGALARLLEAVDVVRDAHLVPSSLAVPAWKMGNILASLKAYNMQSVARFQ